MYFGLNFIGYVLQIFSHVVVCGLPFNFLNSVFGREKLLGFDEIQFFYF